MVGLRTETWTRNLLNTNINRFHRELRFRHWNSVSNINLDVEGNLFIDREWDNSGHQCGHSRTLSLVSVRTLIKTATDECRFMLRSNRWVYLEELVSIDGITHTKKKRLELTKKKISLLGWGQRQGTGSGTFRSAHQQVSRDRRLWIERVQRATVLLTRISFVFTSLRSLFL